MQPKLLQLERSFEKLHDIIAGLLAHLCVGLDMYYTTPASVSSGIRVFTATVERVEEMRRPRRDTDRYFHDSLIAIVKIQ